MRLLPLGLLVACALVYPLGQALWISLHSWNDRGHFVSAALTLSNYLQFFSSYRGGVVWQCFTLALSATLVALVLSVPILILAMLVLRRPALTALEVVLIAPLFVSQALRLHSLRILLKSVPLPPDLFGSEHLVFSQPGA